MDSGPVATFQVHEYLRPKVRFLSLNKTLHMAFVALLDLN